MDVHACLTRRGVYSDVGSGERGVEGEAKIHLVSGFHVGSRVP